MKNKLLFYLLLFPLMVFSQSFPSPPSTAQINNIVSQQHQMMMQQQRLMRMLQRNFVTDQQKLDDAHVKKVRIERKIRNLKEELSATKEGLRSLQSSDMELDKKQQKKKKKLLKTLVKTKNKIAKNTLRLRSTNADIIKLEERMEETSKEIEKESKKTKNSK